MFSKGLIKRIFKENGAERISEKAIDIFNQTLTKISKEISSGALQLTHFKGMKIIQTDAIIVSTQQFLGKTVEIKELKRFPSSVVKKVLSDKGVNRVSKESVETLNRILTDISNEIALNAVKSTYKEKKKTIKEDAIKTSTEKIFETEKENESEVNDEGG